MFSEIEQEEIINRFLDNIYVNDMFKIMKNKTLNCPCKMEDEKVELAKLNLPNNIINCICKFAYQECNNCKYLGGLPKVFEKQRRECKAIDGLSFMFAKCHSFPKREVLSKEFQFSKRRYDCLKGIFQSIGYNDFDGVLFNLEDERKQDKTINDLNKVFKFIYDSKRYKKRLCCSHFVECPVFRIPHFPEDD